MSKGLEIDFETADRITLLTLSEQRKYLQEEISQFEQGTWMHPEDVANNIKLIAALNVIIPYFGDVT